MTRTNARSVLTLLLRTFALWLVANGALSIVQWFGARDLASVGEMWAWAVGGYGILLLVALVLWLFADVVAMAALAGPGQITFESEMAPAQWQYLAFATVGLWLAATGILDFAWHAILLTRIGGATPEMEFSPDQRASFVVSMLQTGLGAALVLGGRGIVGLLMRLRGREPEAME